MIVHDLQIYIREMVGVSRLFPPPVVLSHFKIYISLVDRPDCLDGKS